MMTFLYKEPLELLIKTIGNLRSLEGYEKLILLIALEEKTPDREDKITQIMQHYVGVFSQIIVTVHPANQMGEIPGKCSNSNHAQRSILKTLEKQDSEFNIDKYFIVNFDTDTRFSKQFLAKLELEIKSQGEKSYSSIWQPILFYNWELEKRSLIVRVTSIVRNMLMMGCLIPLKLNVMSVFAFSLKLCVEGGFTHPAYQMDDIICYIRWQLKAQNGVILRPLYTAVLSGPTAGHNFFNEVAEWARQIRRWTIGSVEVFHYSLIKISKASQKCKAIIWQIAFFNYYGLFLILQGILMVSSAIALNTIQQMNDFEKYLQIGSIGLNYIMLAFIFMTNMYSTRLLDDMAQREQNALLRSLMAWLISPFVMILYSCVAFYGIMEVAIKGKTVCKHGTSKKNELK